MQTVRNLFVLLFLVLGINAAAPASTIEGGTPAAGNAPPDRAQIETLIGKLEDPQQREELLKALRLLARADSDQDATEDAAPSVKTAAADVLHLLANRVSEVAGSANSLVAAVKGLPGVAVAWSNALAEPATRQHWLRVTGRLFAVLAAGFVAALFTNWLVVRFRRRHPAAKRGSLTVRSIRLAGHFLLDLLPIIAFAAAAYAVLTMVDTRHETRLVAVALINASIITRLLLALSAFLFAPDTPSLRLWRIGDETAQYIHHWIRRLAFIAVYGFFILQAALLLGLGGDAYALLLRLLGAVLLGLLLVLVVQNRHDIGRAIAGRPSADSDEPPQLSPLRKGLARVWHLIAGLYLIVIYLIWAVQVEHAAVFALRATLVSVAVLASMLLLFRSVDRIFSHGLQLSSELTERFPGLEHRLNRYFPVLRKVFKAAIGVFAALLLADAWGVDALGWISDGSGRVLIGAAINILLIVLLAVFLWELASGAIERYLADADGEGGVGRSPRIRTLLTVGRNALLVILTLVSTLMVLSELGINIAPLLAGAGVIGLAIGFGSQRLVQDVINGIFILFQDLMAVGDVVRLGDKAGLVEALSIRTVRLRDLSGTVHTIPFSAIEGVSNLTRDFSFHVFDLGIAYREDVDAVMTLIKQIGGELRDDPEVGRLILEPVEVFGLDAFGDSAIVIKGRIKTRPLKQWQVGRAFNRLVKIRFDEQGIEIPFPHQTLYFGQDKDGSAPPAFVQLEALARES